MRSASPRADVRAEPNLVPILDMVFQLITFFMLVVNFKTASVDASLHLPVVGSAQPVEIAGEDLLVLNVDRRGALRVYGSIVEDVANHIAKESQAKLLAARRYHPERKAGDELDAVVVIRADRATPFQFLNRVIAACQQNGFRNFSFKALDREEL